MSHAPTTLWSSDSYGSYYASDSSDSDQDHMMWDDLYQSILLVCTCIIYYNTAWYTSIIVKPIDNSFSDILY